MNSRFRDQILPLVMLGIGVTLHAVLLHKTWMRNPIDRVLLGATMIGAYVLVMGIAVLPISRMFEFQLSPLLRGLITTVACSVFVAGLCLFIPMGWIIGFFVMTGLLIWLLEAPLIGAITLSILHTATYMAMIWLYTGAKSGQ